MSITELTGKAEDPECLHCALAPFIAAWMEEHPGKQPALLITELAQALGELIGSQAFGTGHANCVPAIVQGAMRETLRSALDLVNTLKRRRS